MNNRIGSGRFFAEDKQRGKTQRSTLASENASKHNVGVVQLCNFSLTEGKRRQLEQGSEVSDSNASITVRGNRTDERVSAQSSHDPRGGTSPLYLGKARQLLA